VIPLEMAEEIAQEAVAMTAFEDFVTEKVKEGNPIIGLYPATSLESKEQFEQWLKDRNIK